MEISGQVKLHCIVPDTPRFVLFGVEVFTIYSRSILPRRYTDFQRFHVNLSYFSHTHYKSGSLQEFLPCLPSKKIFQEATDLEVIQSRKEELDRYVKSVLSLLCSPDTNRFDDWASYIRHFFELDLIAGQEEVCAIKIQEKYKAFKLRMRQRLKTTEKLIRKGWIVNIEELPDSLLLDILSYVQLPQLAVIARLNRRWHKLSKTPLLYKSINLFQAQSLLSIEYFQKVCVRYWQLSVLDLRFCIYVTADSLYAISQTCNPLALKELYLDGCENVDNLAILNLTARFSEGKPKSLQYLEAKEKKNMYFDTSLIELPSDLKGGARGLSVLSLAECRHLSEEGVIILKHLHRLEVLNLLGCVLVDDQAILPVITNPNELKELNLSGTAITSIALRYIRENCTSLRKIDLRACKNLNRNDETELPDLDVIIEEDSIKFHLFPMFNSRVPKITSSILKTRSTLSVQRVLHFILKKLLRPDLEIDVLFKHKVMPLHLTLADIRDLNDMPTLVLHYQLKEETREMEEAKVKENWAGKMPQWVPDIDVGSCMRCGLEFSLWIWRHHCRNCGKVVCKHCSNEKRFIPSLGFTKNKVRVCSFCANFIKR